MKVLGLDLGVGSVGWCLIEVDGKYNPIEILGMGSRILSLTPDESSNFDRGNGESVCAQRTFRRTARKMLCRYKMRRRLLRSQLAFLGMLDSADSLNSLSPLELWKLRSDAATSGVRLTLPEIGRVLLHLNQKRGYKHAKTDVADAKQTEFVQDVNRNYAEIRAEGKTYGQHFYERLLATAATTDKGAKVATFRIRENVFPRQAYEDEFDTIMRVQRKFYPEILTDEVIAGLRNAIFFQRPLKSCKHLVSVCEFEGKNYCTADGREVFGGPKVAPRTSPLAQVCRLYEVINNIRLVNVRNKDAAPIPDGIVSSEARKSQYQFVFTAEERERIYEFLNTHEKMTVTDLLKLIGLKRGDGFRPDQSLGKGIPGNKTYTALFNALEGVGRRDELLRFNLRFIDGNADSATGDVRRVVSPDFINEPLYRLWHTAYSIADRDELAAALAKNFGITDPAVVDRIFAIDFTGAGFSNRSARFMRRIIPYLAEGMVYSDAAAAAGVNHSASVTAEENATRVVVDHLDIIKKGSLRQPVIEKILNQMIHVVNSLIAQFGPIDEVRVELARSLKQSAKERSDASTAINAREKENKALGEKIAEYGLTPSRRTIQKLRLWEETEHVCMYCGQPVSATEFLTGDAEVEHIIPRSIFFDDSLSNKTCACRRCNKAKNNRTAYDFMKEDHTDEEFRAYIARVEAMAEAKKISRTKRDRLLCPKEEIPSDFLERDLRQSQYIARKAMEILHTVVRNVWATSGSVTDFFRHQWGYDRILHDLSLDKYASAGLVEEVEYEHKGQTHRRQQIKNWSKRFDHRHHAVDALVIALTRQGYVQRLNNLNAEHGNIHAELVKENADFTRNKSQLELWASTRPRFDIETVRKAVEGIAVSFKSGKKLTTPGKRAIMRGGKKTVVQDKLVIPRGALHQETVYGLIRLPDGRKTLKYAFDTPTLVSDPAARKAIQAILEHFGGNVKKALKSLPGEGLEVMRKGKRENVTEVSCHRFEYVVRKSVAALKYKDILKIVDGAVRRSVEGRFAECGNKDSEYQKSFAERPLILPGAFTPIRTVRIATGLKPKSMAAVRRDSSGNPIGYAKTASNHHIAIYEDSVGRKLCSVTSMWDGVLRRLNGIPVIVKHPDDAWNLLMGIADEDVRERLAASLPRPDWKFLMSLQMNQMFVLGLSEDEFNDAVRNNDRATLAAHLYRVQKLADNDFFLRRHTNTTADDTTEFRKMLDVYRLSTQAFLNLNPHKVKITPTGDFAYD